MCECSRRLVAWIDGEVSSGEAAEIARRVAECAECRSCAAELRRASGTLEEYCEAVLQASERSEARWQKPALLAAAAAVALALVVTHWRRPAMQPVQTPSENVTAATTAQHVQTVVASASGRQKRGVQRSHKRRPPATPPPQARAQTASAGPFSDEPALRIAIPADAIFAPGALPDGMIFVADLSIGVDGRVEQLRLLPQPVPYERRLEQ